jgi:hypothetical protein
VTVVVLAGSVVVEVAVWFEWRVVVFPGSVTVEVAVHVTVAGTLTVEV